MLRCLEVGDRSLVAGDFTRQGSYPQYQIVDERIAGQKNHLSLLLWQTQLLTLTFTLLLGKVLVR